MKGKFIVSYSFDETMEDEPYQARATLNTVNPEVEISMIDAWGTSYGEAKSKLIKIIESIPDDEEVEICGI